MIISLKKKDIILVFFYFSLSSKRPKWECGGLFNRFLISVISLNESGPSWKGDFWPEEQAIEKNPRSEFFGSLFSLLILL